MRDNNLNIGDPDYNHNIDILLGSIIDRANLRRSTTSSTTTNHQPLHLHQSGSTSTSTTYLPQQQEEIDIGIIGTIYSLEPTQPLCTTFTSSTTAPVRQQQLQPEHRQQHHNINMINNIESPEDAHQEEFDNNRPVHLAIHEDHLLQQQQHGNVDWNNHRSQHLLNITSTTTTLSSERRTQSLHQQHRIRHQHHLVHHPRQLHLHLEDRPSTGDHQQHRS